MRSRILGLSLLIMVALQFVLLTPAGANDGDQLCRNTDSFSGVYVSAGKARVNLCQLNDCPAFVTNCTVQVRWLTKCEWAWCTTFDDRSGWVVVNGNSTVSWCQDGKQQYKLEYKTTWNAPAVKTMRYLQRNEYLLEIGGGGLYRGIIGAYFNATNGTGSNYGTVVQTVTATGGETTPKVVATSGSSWITLSC